MDRRIVRDRALCLMIGSEYNNIIYMSVIYAKCIRRVDHLNTLLLMTVD